MSARKTTAKKAETGETQPAKAAAKKATAKAATPSKAPAPKATARKAPAKKAAAKKTVARKSTRKSAAKKAAPAPRKRLSKPRVAPATAPEPAPAPVQRDTRLADNWKRKPVEELLDAEIGAMPDDAYMNDTQLAFFRLKLTRLRDTILEQADRTTDRLRTDTVVVPDPADRATIEEEHALELRTRDRERKLLKKIDQSIARIDAGDYGYCDETGEPIGVARLLARPTATLSLEAQERREHRQKMFGD
ncbi:MAG: RNA polymerase-binding protein DksA [Ottowia sp.]|nr:RNA polymerase-binding protein DksA [Ottowia sp.]